MYRGTHSTTLKCVPDLRQPIVPSSAPLTVVPAHRCCFAGVLMLMRTRWPRQSSGYQQMPWYPCLGLCRPLGAAQLLHPLLVTPLMPLAVHLLQQLLPGMTLQIWNPWALLGLLKPKLLLVGHFTCCHLSFYTAYSHSGCVSAVGPAVVQFESTSITVLAVPDSLS